MIKVSVDTASIQELAELQKSLNNAAVAVGVQTGGMARQLTAGLMQLQRFVVANIEVDTGRTKNSIFPSVEAQGNNISAMLGTNVHYSPYVRDAGHRQPFFEYAAEVEGPRVLDMLGEGMIISVENQF